MHVALNRKGECVVEGEGTFRVPMSVEETDNSLSNPVATAEAFYEHERETYAHMAAQEEKQNRYERFQRLQIERMQDAAQDQAEYQREAEASETGGQHPLTYLAALQTMAGNSSEQYSPISGYLLSQDGVPAFDRTMNGYKPMRGMGDWLSDLEEGVSSAKEASEYVQDEYYDAQEFLKPSPTVMMSEAVIQKPLLTQIEFTQPAVLTSVSKKSWMDKKVGGIPVAFLAAGGLAYLLLKKK